MRFLGLFAVWGLLVSGAAAAGSGTAAQSPGGAADSSHWNSVFIGGHLGGGRGLSDWFDIGAGDIGSHHPAGVLGGLQGGFDHPIGNWVLGAQADVSWNRIEGNHLDAIFQFGPFPEFDHSEADVLGTLTGRFGYTRGPALLYARAGAAWVHERYWFEGFFEPGRTFAETTVPRWGWTPGAGLEYSIASHWSAFVEYNYLNFGTRRTVITCTAEPDCGPPGAGAITVDIRENLHVVKAGLNYRFAD